MTIQSRPPTSNFDEGFDRIFGSPDERKARRVKEAAEKAENEKAFKQATKSLGASAQVQNSIQPFKSPIDGSIITCRSQLKEHNKRHGVTDSRDYSPEYYAKKAVEHKANTLGQTPEARHERRQLIEKTLYKYGVLR